MHLNFPVLFKQIIGSDSSFSQVLCIVLPSTVILPHFIMYVDALKNTHTFKNYCEILLGERHYKKEVTISTFDSDILYKAHFGIMKRTKTFNSLGGRRESFLFLRIILV